MALIKSIEGETGVSAEYWRVIEVNLNYFAGVGAVALVGYVSKATRNAGKRPLDAKQFPIQGPAFEAFSPAAMDAAGRNHVKAAYEHVKGFQPAEGQPANPFLDAQDDD